MVRYGMGRLEEAVLLAVVRLGAKGYGVTIRRDVNERLDGGERSFGAIYATLERLEGKGFISSKLGDPTPERGGKPKRFYKIEAPGVNALAHARADTTNMWAGFPARAPA
jgi:PadR family transcriptional regulator, regulatory protein PadR